MQKSRLDDKTFRDVKSTKKKGTGRKDEGERERKDLTRLRRGKDKLNWLEREKRRGFPIRQIG